MKNIKNMLDALIEEGNRFEYQNFATQSPRGYVDHLSSDWIVWVERINRTIRQAFAESSAPRILVEAADAIVLVGNGREEFEAAKDKFCAALQQASKALKDDKFDELIRRNQAISTMDLSNRVFIVHGHDDKSKNELEILLRDMGLEPVVLHRQIDGGLTIIEKFESNADVGYAFILLTPDEITYLAKEETIADDKRNKEYRARPNVIWEFGYFVGRLGRNRTCCLHNGNVVLPSDLNGLIYKKYHNSVEELGWSIQKELRAIGYKLA